MPIINENDTVVTDEIKFGDNDTLGALVANLIEGDALIILTDQTRSVHRRSAQGPDGHARQQADAGDAGTRGDGRRRGHRASGRGGMLTKILAAKRAAHSGANTVIASGREADVLSRLASGEAIGTQLIARTARLAARKQWMADHLQVRGHVVIDDGAGAKKLTEGGKSLLPIGVVDVQGAFARGEVIACLNPRGREIARGTDELQQFGSTADPAATRAPRSNRCSATCSSPS